jgi:hypothetical protein
MNENIQFSYIPMLTCIHKLINTFSQKKYAIIRIFQELFW